MYTTSNLKPELQLKALKYRQAFVDAANAALQKGRSQSDAEFVGMAAVARLESIDAKNAAVAIQKDVTSREPPSHLAAILRARELRQKEASESAQKAVKSINLLDVPEVVEMTFDQDGYLIVKFSNGKTLRSKNRSPAVDNVTQHIAIAGSSSTGTGVNEFSDENELSREFFYNANGAVRRKEYQSGNFKTYEYDSNGLLVYENYIKGLLNYRKTYIYDEQNRLVRIVYEVVSYEPPEFTGFFVQQYSEPQQLEFSGFFLPQYSEPPTMVFDGFFSQQFD